MCETCVLGVKWPQWHPLLFEGQVAVGMTVVCPQDLEKMLLEQASMVYWKRWAAEHECELESIQAMLRRKMKHGQTSTAM